MTPKEREAYLKGRLDGIRTALLKNLTRPELYRLYVWLEHQLCTPARKGKR